MKFNLLFFVIALACAAQGNAQIVQKGMVFEQSSKGKALSDVQIVSDKGVPTSTGSDGIFKLVIDKGKGRGAPIAISAIKRHYGIVNEQTLWALQISSTDLLAVPIYMADSSVIDRAKQTYSNSFQRELSAGYMRMKQALDAQYAKGVISLDSLQVGIAALDKNKAVLSVRKDAFVDRVCAIDRKRMDPGTRKSLDVLEKVGAEKAASKMEDGDILHKTDLSLDQIKEFEDPTPNETIQFFQQMQQLDVEINSVMLQADFYLLDFELDKADSLIDTLAGLDTTSTMLLQNTATYWLENGSYAKSLEIDSMILRQSSVTAYDSAAALMRLGDGHCGLLNMGCAIDAYEQAHKLLIRLYFQDSLSVYLKANYAESLAKLAKANAQLGKDSLALSYLQTYAPIQLALCQSPFSRPRFLHDMATYNMLAGDIYFQMGDPINAKQRWLLAQETWGSVLKAAPDRWEYLQGLENAAQRLTKIVDEK